MRMSDELNLEQMEAARRILFNRRSNNMEEQYKSGSRTKPNIFDCPESFAKWYCVNGATCFMVKAQNSSLYNCWCKDGFHGLRCEYKYVVRRPEALESIGNTDEGRSHFTFIRSVQSVEKLSENLKHGHEAMTKSLNHQSAFLVSDYAAQVLVLLLLLLLLMLIFYRWQKRKEPHIIPDSDRRADLLARNNELINQDRIAAEFALIESLNHLRRQLPPAQLQPAVSKDNSGAHC